MPAAKPRIIEPVDPDVQPRLRLITGLDREGVPVVDYIVWKLQEALKSGEFISIRGVMFRSGEKEIYNAHLITAYGEVRVGLNLERQQKADGGSSTQTKWATEVVLSEIPEKRDPHLVVSDSSAGIELKIQALSDLISSGDCRLESIIISELSKSDAPPEWRDALICASEHIQFYLPDHRVLLTRHLRERAVSLLESSRPQTESILWVAIRRYASLIPATESASLLTFLGASASVATRQVVMQAIQAIFEIAPPSDIESLKPLTSRVSEFCAKYIDPDVMASKELAALGLNAFLALAVMANPDAVDHAGRMKETGNDWLIRRATEVLNVVRNKWIRLGVSSVRVIEECLASLRIENVTTETRHHGNGTSSSPGRNSLGGN